MGGIDHTGAKDAEVLIFVVFRFLNQVLYIRKILDWDIRALLRLLVVNYAIKASVPTGERNTSFPTVYDVNPLEGTFQELPVMFTLQEGSHVDFPDTR